ncbi:hypothetical protein GGR56DRAFT_672359 [Xylariaceae sp. FL0804]|nr:hypothetical protein GGR56DRAFT_672359 [Xylariaceae sp. FL0804]
MAGHKYTPLHESQGARPRSYISSSLFFACLASLPLTLILGFLSGQYWQHATRGDIYELPSDRYFGDVSRRPVVMENDQRFVDAAPYVYDHANRSLVPSLWDTVYPGTFVAIADPAAAGLRAQGMPIRAVAADPDAWPEAAEGFGVAAMHQLHCVMSIKHALLSYERGDATHEGHGTARPDHLHHCLEMLRQAVMCHADLSLDRPVDGTRTQVSTGWGSVHMCRDWSEIYRAVMSRRIGRRSDTGKWVDMSEDGP